MGILLVGLTVALGTLGAGECEAANDFEFTVRDYANMVWYWEVSIQTVHIQNTGTVADTVNLYYSSPGVSGWYSDVCIRGKCISGGYATITLAAGQLDSILVEIYTAGTPDMGQVTMRGVMRGDPSKTDTVSVTTFGGLPSMLLVDDDAGASYESHMLSAVENAGYKARHWDADSLGRPNAAQLCDYWAILWTTADGSASYLTASDETTMATYLDSGGNMLLASMGYLTSRGGATAFTSGYLHVASWVDDSGGGTMTGYTGDAVSDGMSLDLSGGPFSAADTDDMVLSLPADSVFSGSAGVTGLKVAEAGRRVCFLAFPFEDVSTSDPDPDNQTALMTRIIDWFGPPVAGVDVAVPVDAPVLYQNSPNPFSASTRIAFEVPHGSRYVDLTVYNVQGRLVKSLASGMQGTGRASLLWDGTDDAGRTVGSGVYFYRLSADGATSLRKMLLIR